MKTYLFSVKDKSGNVVAECEIPHDGIHKGARERAKAQARAWMNREGHKGRLVCCTFYGSNPEPEHSAAIAALDKVADAYEELGKRVGDAVGAIADKLSEINSGETNHNQ